MLLVEKQEEKLKYNIDLTARVANARGKEMEFK